MFFGVKYFVNAPRVVSKCGGGGGGGGERESGFPIHHFYRAVNCWVDPNGIISYGSIILPEVLPYVRKYNWYFRKYFWKYFRTFVLSRVQLIIVLSYNLLLHVPIHIILATS